MKRDWILVIDSGIGGLWTLKEIQKRLPYENYIYFMDAVNAPYGNKSVKKLKKIVMNIITKISSIYKIKAIVLACNTISSVCYDYIVSNFSIPIFKIEPVYNPKLFNGQNTLLLATKNTIQKNKNLAIYENYPNIFLYGFKTIAKKIDEANGNYNILEPYLERKLRDFKNKNIKNIVLGCTHFNYIKTELKNIFGEVKFFENSKNLAKNIKKSIKKAPKTQFFAKNKQKKGKFLLLKKI